MKDLRRESPVCQRLFTSLKCGLQVCCGAYFHLRCWRRLCGSHDECGMFASFSSPIHMPNAWSGTVRKHLFRSIFLNVEERGLRRDEGALSRKRCCTIPPVEICFFRRDQTLAQSRITS